MFTDDLFDLLLKETINYSRTQREQPDFDLNAVELNGFLGATMIMSMIRVPFIEDYWSQENVFGQIQIKNLFVRRRYREILSSIHLCDKTSPQANRDSDLYDRLHNIRPMIDILNRNFQASFNLGRELSFDEFMVKFKGSLFSKL